MANRGRRKQEHHPQTSEVVSPLMVFPVEMERHSNSYGDDEIVLESEDGQIIDDQFEYGQAIDVQFEDGQVIDGQFEDSQVADGQFLVINEEEIVTGALCGVQQPDGSYIFTVQEGGEEVQLVADEVAAEEEVVDFDTTPAGIESMLKVVNSYADVYENSRRNIHRPYPTSKTHHQHGGKKISRYQSPPMSSRKPIIMSRNVPKMYIKHRAGSPRSVVPEIDTYTDDEDEGDVDENEDEDVASGYDSKGLRHSRKPKKRGYAHRLQWSPESMKVALDAVKVHNMTIRGAAKKYTVPYSTLKDRVTGRVTHGSKPGVKTTLSPEEEMELEDCIRRIKESGFQMHCIDIREKARELLLLNGGNNTRYGMPNRQVIPGHNWLAGFFKRHKGIEIKRSVKHNTAPSVVKQKQIIKSFFDIVQRAYNCATPNTLTRRLFMLREVTLASHGGARLLVAASAEGSFLPPFVMFRNSDAKVTSPDKLKNLCPDGRFYASASGCVTAEILLTWFRDLLVTALRGVRRSALQPAVLFMTQPIGNVSVRLVKLAENEHVQLICIPSGIAHLVQPFNDSMTISLDSTISHRASKLLNETGEAASSQLGLASVLFKVWKNDLPKDLLKKNFHDNGLLPLNPRAISMDRIMSTASPFNQSINDNDGSSSPNHDADEEHNLNLLSHSSSYYDSIGANRGTGSHNVRTKDEAVENHSTEARGSRRAGASHHAVSHNRGGLAVRYAKEQEEEREDEQEEEDELYSTYSASRGYFKRKRHRVRASPVSSPAKESNLPDSSRHKRSSPDKRSPPTFSDDSPSPAKKLGLYDGYTKYRQILDAGAPRLTTVGGDQVARRVGSKTGVSPATGVGGGGGCSRTRPTSRPYTDIHSEIAAARNPDVMKTAIDSIMELLPGQTGDGECTEGSGGTWGQTQSGGALLEEEQVEEQVEEQPVMYEDGVYSGVDGYEHGDGVYKMEGERYEDEEVEEVDETSEEVPGDVKSIRFDETTNIAAPVGSVSNVTPHTAPNATMSLSQLLELNELHPNHEIQIVTMSTMGGKPTKIIRRITMEELLRQEAFNVSRTVRDGDDGGGAPLQEQEDEELYIKAEVQSTDGYCQNVVGGETMAEEVLV